MRWIVLALGLAAAGCGSDCPQVCSKIKTCLNGTNQPCDETQCKRICEKERDVGGGVGVSDQLSCVADSTCEDLSKNACLYKALDFELWCQPVEKP